LKKLRLKLPFSDVLLVVAVLWTVGTMFFSPWGEVLHQVTSRGLVFLVLGAMSETLFVAGLVLIGVGARSALASSEGLFVLALNFVLAGLLAWAIKGLHLETYAISGAGVALARFGPGGNVRQKFSRTWALRKQFKPMLARARESWLCRVGFFVNAVGAVMTAVVVIAGALTIFPWRSAIGWVLFGLWDIMLTLKLRMAVMAASRQGGATGG